MSFEIGRDNYSDLIYNRDNLLIALTLTNRSRFSPIASSAALQDGRLRPILESLWRNNTLEGENSLKVSWLQRVNDRVRNPILLLEQAVAEIELFHDQISAQKAQDLFFSAVQILHREEAIDPRNKNFKRVIDIYRNTLEQKCKELGLDFKVDFDNERSLQTMKHEAKLAQEVFKNSTASIDKKRVDFSETTIKTIDRRLEAKLEKYDPSIPIPSHSLEAQEIFQNALGDLINFHPSISNPEAKEIHRTFYDEYRAQESEIDSPLMFKSQISAIRESANVAMAKLNAILISQDPPEENTLALYNLFKKVSFEADYFLSMHSFR